MKAKNIKEYETGEHCYGQILTVNGKDYREIQKKEVIEFLNDMFENDVNSNGLLLETFKNALEHMDIDCIESDDSTCDQCGNWNHYEKYSIEKQNENS